MISSLVQYSTFINVNTSKISNTIKLFVLTFNVNLLRLNQTSTFYQFFSYTMLELIQIFKRQKYICGISKLE